MAGSNSTLERLREKMAKIDEEEFDTGYNIVMLGTSGVGKTVFMTTMLYDFMTCGSSLRIDTYDTAQKNQLLESYKSLCAGEEIPATGRYEAWRFQVLYDAVDLFSFRWIDYRGGSVNFAQIRSGTNDMDIQAVVDLLRKPGTLAIFVLADAERFQKDPSRIRAELQGIRFILEDSLEDSEVKRRLHLLLVLTKCDVVALERRWVFWRDWNRDKMLRCCQKVFSEVFLPFMQKNKDVVCDAVPLSSYGKSSIRSGDGRIQVCPGVNKIDSYQIDVPLRMAFKYILKDLETRIPEMTQETRTQKAVHQVALPPWWHIFSDRRTHKEAIRECDALLKHLQKLSVIISKIVAETEHLNPVCWHLA